VQDVVEEGTVHVQLAVVVNDAQFTSVKDEAQPLLERLD